VENKKVEEKGKCVRVETQVDTAHARKGVGFGLVEGLKPRASGSRNKKLSKGGKSEEGKIG